MLLFGNVDAICSLAYMELGSVSLFYEAYPGSINDVSQMQYMFEKAAAYGYKT